jgi:hypothetical protein
MMGRKVHIFGDKGIPLGCIVDEETSEVLAYGQGSTFSKAGLQGIASPLFSYTALFDADAEEGHGPFEIEVYAVDLDAALLWLREHYIGRITLFVDPAPMYLGKFDLAS